MNEVEIFKNEEFGEVRVVEKDGEPWFVAKDVCDILEYKNPSRDISRHVDDDDRYTITVERGGSLTVINESGIYSLIVRSNMPEAKKFKKWVTSEVLPSIRKNGAYIAGQNTMTEEEIMAQALISANRIIEEKKKETLKLKAEAIRNQPKVEFYDQVINSDGAMSMNDTAKVLGIPNFGRTKLFQYLRDRVVLDGNNVPYQKFVDAGWFNVTESKYETDWGINITRTTRVYQKGLDGIRRALKKDGYFKKENKIKHDN